MQHDTDSSTWARLWTRNSRLTLWVMGAYGEHLGRTTVGFDNLIAAIRNNKKMRSYIGATRFQYQVVQLATQISLHVREGIMNSVVSEVAHLATRSMRVLSRPALTEILHNHAVPWLVQRSLSLLDWGHCLEIGLRFAWTLQDSETKTFHISMCCPQLVMLPWKSSVNIDTDNGLVPSGTKPLSVPMLT